MSTTPKPTQASPRLAILDDYANIATVHFSHIPGLQTDSFAATLNPSKKEDLNSLITRLRPYQIISTMRERTPFPSQVLKELPQLKLLLTTSARNASIDLACASERRVIVTGTKGDRPPPPPPPSNESKANDEDFPPPVSASSVNQHAWALLLSLCSRIPADNYALKHDRRAWQSGLTVPLGGKTLGCVGLGKLGSQMAKTAVLGLGMQVVAWSENLTQERADEEAEKAGLPKGTFKAVGKGELFRTADVVSLHVVLSERSRGVVGREELGRMKTSAILINTSRGGLIDEAALLQTLREGRIRGVGLDVFWEEPLPDDSPWRSSKDFKSEVVLSPHMGYANAVTMNRWYQEQAEIVQLWMRGEDVPNRMN